jgi:hypothetical protein
MRKLFRYRILPLFFADFFGPLVGIKVRDLFHVQRDALLTAAKFSFRKESKKIK